MTAGDDPRDSRQPCRHCQHPEEHAGAGHRVPMTAEWDADANEYRCRTCRAVIIRTTPPDYWKHAPVTAKPEAVGTFPVQQCMVTGCGWNATRRVDFDGNALPTLWLCREHAQKHWDMPDRLVRLA